MKEGLTIDRDVPGEAEPRPPRRERVVELLRGVSFVLRHHNAPEEVVRSFNQQASDYLDVEEESTFIKRAKYLLAAPMAVYLSNKPPPAPDVEWTPKGSWLRWSKGRLRAFRERNTHLWFSFFQAKRSAATVSSDIVLENLEKHRAQMAKDDPLSGPEHDELIDELMTLLEPILRQLCDGITKDLASFFDDPGNERHQASLNASLEGTRKSGGQAGFLRTHIRHTELMDEGDLHSIHERRGPHLKDKELTSVSLQETRERLVEGAELADLINESIARCADGIPLLEARVEAVLEPLKVRTISKGPSVEYYLGKPVQQALHGRMRKMKPFRLIGTPFCPTMLSDLRSEWEREWLRDREDVNWCSVDYSAATDGLSARLSGEIMDRLLHKLAVRNLGLYYLLRGVLAPHKISYPPIRTKNGLVQLEEVTQKNGQLMGSILSFPVLCLANYGLFLLVKSRSLGHSNIHWVKDSVLVNGDDMLYIGSHAEWELHQQMGKRIGLEFSPGKAYIHPTYANVNSVSVHYDLRHSADKIPSHPKKVGYLNTGLIWGKHKVQGKVGTDDPLANHPISASINEILEGCYWKKEEVLKFVLNANKKDLQKETRGRNLFLPISVGGLGVNPPVGWKFHVTKEQREWAGAIWTRACTNKIRWLYVAERPLKEGLLLRPRDDRLIDPVRPATEASERLRMPKGSQKGLERALKYGLLPYYRFDSPADLEEEDPVGEVGAGNGRPKTLDDGPAEHGVPDVCKDLRAKQNAERLHGVSGGAVTPPPLSEQFTIC